MRYAIKLAPDDDGSLLVTAPDIPEAVTFGADRADALARAVEAIETAIMGFMAAREDIPRPKAKGREFVALPALAAAKIALYRAMREEGVGKAELGRRLSVALPQIDRLLDLRHNSRIDSLVDALAAVGRTLEIVVEKAA